MHRVGIAFLTAAMVGLVGMSAGSAADLGSPAYKAPPPPAAPFSWTGFYIGGNIGAGWGTSDTTLILTPALGFGFAGNLPVGTLSPSGILGGVQAGYNWQVDWLVLGVEDDFDGARINSNSSCTNALLGTSSAIECLPTSKAVPRGRIRNTVRASPMRSTFCCRRA